MGMLPDFDKNAAFIWACYSIGFLAIMTTLLTVTIRARVAKNELLRLEARNGEGPDG